MSLRLTALPGLHLVARIGEWAVLYMSLPLSPGLSSAGMENLQHSSQMHFLLACGIMLSEGARCLRTEKCLILASLPLLPTPFFLLVLHS